MFTSVSHYKKKKKKTSIFTYFRSCYFRCLLFFRERNVPSGLLLRSTKQKVLIFRESLDTFLTRIFGIARHEKKEKYRIERFMYCHYCVSSGTVNGYCYAIRKRQNASQKRTKTFFFPLRHIIIIIIVQTYASFNFHTQKLRIILNQSHVKIRIIFSIRAPSYPYRNQYMSDEAFNIV